MNIDKLRKYIANPPIEYWPEVRWWLAEGLNIDETLKEEVTKLYEKGFGATEFLALPDYGADKARYGWGSEEWVHDSRVIIEKDTEFGMGASMTSGSNWSNANLTTITPDDKAASKELDYTCFEVKGAERFSGPLQKPRFLMPGVNELLLVAVTASKIVARDKKYMTLDEDSTLVLTDQVKDGVLSWTAPADGDWSVNVFWLHGTGQTAEPSYKTSYTINYIDPYGVLAWIKYWDEEVLTPEFKQLIRKNGRVQVYMDSLELSTYGKGGNLWGYHLLDVFRERRGYDFTPYLPFILRNSGMLIEQLEYRYEMKNAAKARKIRNDLYQTMTDMYMENILRPIQEYLHRNAMTLRAEISYGVTFEISQPGKYVDGIETESLEFASQLDSHRGLAGPAHVYGKVFSSETGAALRNYMKGLEWYTQIIYSQFAAGITKTVLHGYSSIHGSEADTYWPGHEGMMPIFSERFGERQPAWRHYGAWTKMLARYQMLLRQGRPRMDLAILRTDYFYNNGVMGIAPEPEDVVYNTRLMRANEGLYWKDCTLQNMGFTYDYFDPSLLKDIDTDGMELAPEGPGYRAIILYQEELCVENARRILELAKKGLPVLIANGITEQVRNRISVTHISAASKTPFLDGREAELCAVMDELKALDNVAVCSGYGEAPAALAKLGVSPRVRFDAPSRNILPVLRDIGDTRYLYLYNVMDQEDQPAIAHVEVESGCAPYRLDCWSGEIEAFGPYAVRDGRIAFDITLNPGEAAMLAFAGGEPARGSDKPAREPAGIADIELNDWTLKVEDWNEGDKVIREEDRGLGYVTREVHYTTRKDIIEAGRVDLVPWKDIPAIGPEVSGVGYYSTTFELPADCGPDTRVILELGSTNESSAAVVVNGVTFPFDFNRLAVDITSAVKPGRNALTVEIATSLNNRLIQRQYYSRTMPESLAHMGDFGGGEGEGGNAEAMNDSFASVFANPMNATVKDYGLTGKTRIRFFK